MEFKQEKTKIDGKEVVVSKFPARYGLGLQVRLVKTVLPIVPTDNNSDTITKMAEGLSGLTDDAVIELVLDLLKQTTVDGKPVGEDAHFDIVFSGEFGLLFDVIKFVLEVNYKSFLEKIGLMKKGSSRLNLTPKSKLK